MGFEILGMVLIIVAFVFIGIECVIPGFGVPGIVGIGCFVVGVALSASTIGEAIKLIAILLVLLAIFVFIVLTLLSKGIIKSPIALQEKLDKESGCISTEDLKYLVGRTGVAMTDLRPAGKISVDDLLIDVVSDGSYLEKGTKVQIFKVSNSSLMVRSIENE